MSAKISAISQLSVDRAESDLTFTSHVFCDFISFQRGSSHSPNSVEYSPKISEELSSDSNLFWDFTNIASHADVLRGSSRIPIPRLWGRNA